MNSTTTTTPPQLFEMQVERFIPATATIEPTHEDYPKVTVTLAGPTTRRMVITHRKSSYTVELLDATDCVFRHEFVGQDAFDDFAAFLSFIN